MDELKKAVAGLPVAVLVGVLAAAAAILFVDALLWLNSWFLPGPHADSKPPLWLLLLAPTAAGIAVGVAIRLMRGEAFITLADVILSAQTRNERFSSVRAHALSVFAAFVSLGGGASVGQYGPLAHMGAYLGYLHWRWSRLLNRRLALAAGAAAAIAAVFHAPLAGMVFAQEVIVRDYSFRSFYMIAAASLSSYLFSTNYFRREPFLQVTQMAGIELSAALAFVAAGVVCGLFAALFVFLTLRTQAWAPRSGLKAPLRPVVAGLATGCLAALTVPDILGVSKPLVVAAVTSGAAPAADAAALTLAGKLLATVLCLGMGFAGSVVSPALTMGAVLGIVIGSAAAALGLAGVPPHIWAVVCMFAVACPAIGASLSGVLIVLELTQSYQLALVSLLAIVPANLVMNSVHGGSYYDRQLALRGRAARSRLC